MCWYMVMFIISSIIIFAITSLTFCHHGPSAALRNIRANYTQTEQRQLSFCNFSLAFEIYQNN